MENELLKLTNDEELKITSVELVDIINQFRQLESSKANKNYVKLKHNDFMVKIRKELEALNSLGLDGERNFSQSSYINTQNKTQPCFILNRDGMLQMLNSESALVRYKTIEYINKLENKLKAISEESKIEQLQNKLDETILKFEKDTEEAKKMYKPSHKMKLDYSKMIRALTNNEEEYKTVRDWCFGLMNITKWEDSCIDDAPKIMEIINTVSRLIAIKKFEQISMF